MLFAMRIIGTQFRKVWNIGIEKKELKLISVELPNGQMMKEIDQGGYQYLDIAQVDEIKETDMTDKYASN